MLSHTELLAWSARVGLSEQAQSLIQHVRSSDPSRRVGGGRHNVSGRYPSRKMRVTIQFESHRVELAAVHEMEYDATCLEYFDQPPSIILDYCSANGRHLTVRHTPDFFVIRETCAGWEEWKTEDELQRLAAHNPNRYLCNEGVWHCPPGEVYASRLGLYYRVRSSKEIHWGFQRNIQFLQDYLRTNPDSINAMTRHRLVAYAHVQPGISLAEFIQGSKDFAKTDDIYLMIAHGLLYVDLYAARSEERRVG